MDRHDGDPMESKQMIVIIAVVVVVIAAVGAYCACSGGEDEPGEVDDGRDSLTITEYPPVSSFWGTQTAMITLTPLTSPISRGS